MPLARLLGWVCFVSDDPAISRTDGNTNLPPRSEDFSVIGTSRATDSGSRLLHLYTVIERAAASVPGVFVSDYDIREESPRSGRVSD